MLVALVLLVNAKDDLMQKKAVGQEVTEDTCSFGDSDYEAVGDSELMIPPKSRGECTISNALSCPSHPCRLSVIISLTSNIVI